MPEDNRHEAISAFTRYTQAFQSLDAERVARCFHYPALMSTPHGVVAFNGAADARTFYGGVMAELPKQGYAKTELPNLHARALASDLVVVSGVGRWVDQRGAELPGSRFGATYTLHAFHGAWLIIVALIHDPAGQL